MGTVHSSEGKNNLELYLNDVYEKECEFKIEKEETEFIQTGIETLVQGLVDKILADDSTHKVISDEINKIPSLKQEMYHEKSIVEVYFPIQSDSLLQRYVTENESQVKFAKSSIIKVGSFYDGTKNNFPDEFDFIFPLLGVRTSSLISYQHILNVVTFEDFKTICEHKKHMHYTSTSDKHRVTRKLEFDEYISIHGPAHKLRFIYNNGLGEQRHIHVDLVPAYRIIDSNTLQWFLEEVTTYVEPKSFREEILAAGSSLSVRGNITFTEIEQYFMKNILSKKHVKVYRILKYLLNGHGDGEKFEELFSDIPYYTSYRIKILIIYHHEACTNTGTENLGPCVLQVLQEMSKYNNAKTFLRFIRSYVIKAFDYKVLIPYLKSTIKTLLSMQTSEDSYCYERDKMKSVLGQYLVSSSIQDQNEYTTTRRCCVLL